METQGLKNWAVVVAAGMGRRMGGPVSKQFLEVGGVPLVVHALRAFGRWPGLSGCVVVSPSDELAQMRELVEMAPEARVLRVVEGGAERADSVRNGLEALTEAADSDIVLIHDGVRPFPPTDRFEELCRAAAPDGALLAVGCRDTVKVVTGDRVERTLDRSELYLAQTPQAFPYKRILDAHHLAVERGLAVTDDASLIEALGGQPAVVESEQTNMKVTTPEDMLLARGLTGGQVRVGHGYDVHKLVEGRALVLGGVKVEFHLGLAGHSDADVLAHAVADGCLGAAGLGDIGKHFPDTDTQWEGACSMNLLSLVAGKVAEQGARVVNVDATLVAQRPKVAPHVPEMKENIAKALGVDSASVNVKATTTEGLGFEGRGEGMSAHAVVLVEFS